MTSSNNETNQNPDNSNTYRFWRNKSNNVKGTYGEQQRARGFKSTWTDYRKQNIYTPFESPKEGEKACPGNDRENTRKRTKPQEKATKQQTPIESATAQKTIGIINKAKRKTRGYVYFKEWNYKGIRWYKLGITNDLKRRDAEQNVLPVPPKLLAALHLNSMETAREIEQDIHKLLDANRIKNAQNRELFELAEDQAESIRAALNSFGE